ncbi:BTAD domain-containing putative transcriptional regulator [Micromonospora sp. NPDC007208]|uniref:AfsR/SARP family transcriptional regulator n=1 Tax=Micromonospora sp. NPDC007208 TaxID=3364236 RepID=UPI0036A198DC
MNDLQFRVLGPLRLWRDGREIDAGPRQQRFLLLMLLIQEGRPVSTSELVQLLWGGEPPASAVNAIHKYVAALRRIFEPDLPARSSGTCLLRHGDGYRLISGPDSLDLSAFRRTAAMARTTLAAGRLVEAHDLFLDALRHWHGSPGDRVGDNATAASALAALENDLFTVVADATRLALRLNRPNSMLTFLWRAVACGALNEQVHALLIQSLAAAGQQAEALAVFQTIRDRLVGELGIDPGADLQAAHRQVLLQSVTAAGSGGARAWQAGHDLAVGVS